jgi:glycosyltransferase involved in cell wall biosynthesis
LNTVISQALATGLPVITTRHSGLPDQVHDGVNGFLVNEADYEALAESILLFLRQPESWPAFSRAARAHVAAHYHSKVLVDQQIGWYEKLTR